MNAIGIGAGGHAKVLLDILLQQQVHSVIGMLDANPVRWGEDFLGVPILGGDEMLGNLIISKNIQAFFLGVGAVKSLAQRRMFYEYALCNNLSPLSVVHSSAIISPRATLGAGSSIMADAIINIASNIGDNVLINTGAIVEHDCTIGNHVHIATGACLCGGVVVGDEAMVGAGSVLRQGVRVGKRAVVGAGAVVTKDVPDNCVVVGNPAKRTGS